MNLDKLDTLRNNIAVLLTFTVIEPRIIAKLSGPNHG